MISIHEAHYPKYRPQISHTLQKQTRWKGRPICDKSPNKRITQVAALVFATSAIKSAVDSSPSCRVVAGGGEATCIVALIKLAAVEADRLNSQPPSFISSSSSNTNLLDEESPTIPSPTLILTSPVPPDPDDVARLPEGVAAEGPSAESDDAELPTSAENHESERSSSAVGRNV